MGERKGREGGQTDCSITTVYKACTVVYFPAKWKIEHCGGSYSTVVGAGGNNCLPEDQAAHN